MKNFKNKLVLSLILGIIFLQVLNVLVFVKSEQYIPKMSATPLNIDGNAALDAYCNGTDGLTWETAHVIEDLKIDATGSYYGIRIRNTNRKLIIRNCEVWNVDEDDTAPEDPAAIVLRICQNVRILDCYAHHSPFGIGTDTSSNVLISGNRITKCIAGIVLMFDSIYCNVTNNECNGNIESTEGGGGVGISIWDDSHFNNISYNSFSNNAHDGILIWGSENNTVSFNTMRSNTRYGIELFGNTRYNKIYNNTVCSNKLGNIFDEGVSNEIYANIETCPPSGIPSYSLMLVIGVLSCGIVILSFKTLNKLRTNA